jgi:hypothetical protein
MGFSVAWLAVQGLAKDDVLSRLGLRDTGRVDPTNGTPLSMSMLPAGWIIVFSNDILYAEPPRPAKLSEGCRVVACQVEEHVMASGASLYADGRQEWTIRHVSDNGIFDLSVDGRLPAEFLPIRDRAFHRQDQEEEDAKGVLGADFVFDIPIETAAAICGYRHDRGMFPWGVPVFTCLEDA